MGAPDRLVTSRWRAFAALLPAWCLLVFCASFAGAATARPLAVAVGADGELLELRSGMAMDLLPETSSIPGWNPVLVLDIVRAQGDVERIVVPGTEDIDSESAGQLVYDAGQVFVLWARENLAGEAFLRIESFDGANWGELIDIAHEPASMLGAPRLAVTRDSYTTTTGPAARTVIHVLWWQEDEGDATRARYAPIVLLDGNYAGKHPVIDLAGLDDDASPGDLFVPPGLLHAADFHRGDDGTAVVFATPNALTDRLILGRARALPAALDALADEIRSHIVLIGRKLATDGSLSKAGLARLADEVRSHIVLIGRRQMHRGVAEYIANEVAKRITANDPTRNDGALRRLAGAGADTATAAGRSLIGNELRTEELACSVASIEPTTAAPWGHEIELCLISAPSLPATSASAKHHALVVADDASEAYVLWQEHDAAVSYRHLREGVWSATETVAGGTAVSLSQAVALFRARVGQLQ